MINQMEMEFNKVKLLLNRNNCMKVAITGRGLVTPIGSGLLENEKSLFAVVELL